MDGSRRFFNAQAHRFAQRLCLPSLRATALSRVRDVFLVSFSGLLGACAVPHMPGEVSIVGSAVKACPGAEPEKALPLQTAGESDRVTLLAAAFDQARRQQIFLGLVSGPLIIEENIQAAKQLAALAAQSPGAGAGHSVQGQLIDAIPWLSKASGKATTQSLGSKEALETVERATELIRVVTGKVEGSTELLPVKTSARADNEVNDVKVTTVGQSDRKTLSGDFQRIAAFKAFHLLTLLSAGRIVNELNRPQIDKNELYVNVRLFNIARFLATYFDAYFRGGQFIEYGVNQSGVADAVATTIGKRLGEKLNHAIPDAEVQKIVVSELGKACAKNEAGGVGNCNSPPLGSTSFITRAGFAVQFAGVSVNVGDNKSLIPQATYPKPAEFGPQMTRVLIEAIFDANGPHPIAVHASTACVSGLFSASECLAANGLPDETMTQIDMLAAGAEALATAGAGSIIRGASVSALNNEAIANVLETFAGVTSRKVMERVLAAQANTKSCSGQLFPVAIHVEDTGAGP